MIFDLFDNIKKWFYAIPAIAWLRRVHSRIHAWNRWVGYGINWFIAHPAVAYSVVGTVYVFAVGVGWLLVFLVPGSASAPSHTWLAAFVTSIVVWCVYAIGELAGWLRGRKLPPERRSPWWDHVMDMVGPTWVLVHMLLLRP